MMLALEKDTISSRTDRAIETTPGPAWTTGQRIEEKKNAIYC
jgi:hypothetical protein